MSAQEPARWRVAGGDTRQRLDAWSDILATTHLAFDVRPTHRTPDDFRGAVSRRAIGDLMLVDCAASPFLGHRGRTVMTPESRQEDILGFQLVCKGIETVREGARVLAVTAGDAVIWDGHTPTDVEIVEAFHKRTLLFPRDRVLAVCPRLAELRALPPVHDNGPARLLVRYMNALAVEPALDGAAGVAAANAALELLRAAGPLPGGFAAAERRLGDRRRVPVGVLPRGALFAGVQASVRRHPQRGPPPGVDVAKGPRLCN